MSYPANFTMLKRGYGVSDAAHTVQKYPIGATFTDENGNVYEYAKTAAANTMVAGGVILLLPAGAASLTTTLGANKARIGVAMVAVTAITSTVQYLWVQTKTGIGQTSKLAIAASCAANVGLFSTATAGYVDDAYVAGMLIPGMYINTAAAGASAEINTTAILNFPYLQIAFITS